MKIAVADRYWSTFGGGEQFAGGIAQVLAQRYEVDLLTPKLFDAEVFRERLGIDLSGLRQVKLANPESAVTLASRDYDLLINCTYQSDAVNLASHGIYIVHFPGVLPSRWEAAKGQVRKAVSRIAPAQVRWIEGWHPAESGQRWTNGMSVVEVTSRSDAELTIGLSGAHWPQDRVPNALVKVGATVVHDGPVDRAGCSLRAQLSAGHTTSVVVVCDTWVPADELGTGDNRQLGVLLTALRVGGHALTFGEVAPAGPRDAFASAFVDSYDVVAANSPFTRTWIDQLWGVHSAVLYPPVVMRAGGTKRPVILALGRFFRPASGHCKKQLEMVEAFRALVERGAARGWELHLVGGCSAEHRDYAMAVRRAAEGLPAYVHLNAPGEHLEELLSAASICWHATGLGEDPQRYPDRLEHFGIAVVEAMSAGAVPIVYGQAGPAEVVRDGIDGRHFHTTAELVDVTAALIADEPRRQAMAASAIGRAGDFSAAAFEERLFTLVERVVHGGRGAASMSS